MHLGFHSPKEGDKFDRAAAHIDEQFAALEDVCRHDPGAVERLAPLKESLERTKQEMIRAKQDVEAGEKWSDKLFRKRLLGSTKETVDQLKTLISDNQEVSEVSGPQKEAELRAAMRGAVLISVALNVVIAISMALFFMRNIVEGLNRLADNSFRLARGSALLPASTGGDEIAHQFFQELKAKALNKVTESKAKKADGSATSSNECIELRVLDEGPVVPEEYREAIFHKFEQVKGVNQKSGTDWDWQFAER